MRVTLEILERETGIEPATNGLGRHEQADDLRAGI
jgi:hypothetical protein